MTWVIGGEAVLGVKKGELIIFLQILPLFFCFFFLLQFFAQKTFKKQILISIWSPRHEKAGKNLQHPSSSAVQKQCYLKVFVWLGSI